MKLKISGNFKSIPKELEKINTKINNAGERWAIEQAHKLKAAMIENLEQQGRGGSGPPISPITEILSKQRKESGLREKIVIEVIRSRGRVFATVGFADKEAEMIAKVQNDGAVIPVTEGTRRFFIAVGFPLSSSKTIIYIPGRRFFTKAFNDIKSQAGRNLRRKIGV